MRGRAILIVIAILMKRMGLLVKQCVIGTWGVEGDISCVFAVLFMLTLLLLLPQQRGDVLNGLQNLRVKNMAPGSKDGD